MQSRILILVLLVLLVIGVIFWVTRQGDDEDNGNGADNAQGNGTEVELPSPERLAELLAIHKRAVALAENARNNEAIEEFEKVAAELPNEVAPVRDIAIVRLLAYDLERTPETLALADAAFADWDPLEQDRVLYQRLLGKKLTAQREFQQAIDALKQAAELAPMDVSLWFAIYETANETFDESIAAQATVAVEQAFTLQPENLVLAAQRVRDQAADEDPEILETLDYLERLLLPTREFFETYLQSPVPDYIASIRSAVEAGDWSRVVADVRPFRTIILPTDHFHSDSNRMRRHPLEFIAVEFSPEVMAEIPKEVASIENDVPVTFAPQGDAVAADDVRDIELTDVNLDGRVDLCLLRGESFDVHWGGEGAVWEAGPSVAIDGDFASFVAIDIDGDKEIPFDETILDIARPVSADTADIDFVLAGPAGVLGLRNDLDPASRECTLISVDIDSVFEAAPACGAIVAGDFDSDGDIDLLLDTDTDTTMLWNTELWGFEAQPSETYNLPEGFRWSHADIADIDRDVDMDIVLSGSDGTLGYLEGLRHHTFRWRELSPAEASAAGPVAIVDIDGNASWDVLSAGANGIALHPSQTTGRGAINWREALELSTEVEPEGFRTWDYDNDSRTDLLAWTADGVRILRGSEEAFVEGPALGDVAWTDVRDSAVADLDLDGDLDAVVADTGGAHTLVNDGGNANKFIDLLFTSDKADGDGRGVGSHRVNNNAVGSMIEILADGVYQAVIIRGQRTHIGLGNAEKVDIVRATWTNGAPENFLHAKPLQVVAERQTIITSCPYLYTWNGSEFVFVTDLLWAAPMGLPDPAGGLLPDRHWEYIRIPGEMLVPSDDTYRLQITEELWEASYMDQVQLIAVDHPIGVDIFTNEKVGPPSVAEHRIYTVSERRIPVAATNHRGEDVLSEIAEEDDQYLLLHEWRHMQGYTEDTTLELDLGVFPDDAELVLFLKGWIRPADANLHVRLQQDETLPGPQPPRIEIPDGQGGWRELLGYMGYPNGKTKTIAVPLPNEFVDGDHRIRILTSTELYWDQIFFTVNEPEVEVRETPLPLVSADLHYRGVSALIPHPHHGPELYDYSRVATEPRFYPMEGKFTKFGDVLELLTTIDARHVVFGCGDEMTLEFAVPDEPLPDGWTRDFVLYNIGWEKDCNTNGVLCRTTEPYPFVGMSRYPYPPDEEPPGGETYQEYLDTWQTREMEHLPYLRFVQRFDPNSPAAANPTIISDLLP
jgi:hypothetical protein